MRTLISTAELNALLGSDQLFVFDCRFSLADVTAGARAFAEEHIPGAHYIDLNNQLSAPVIRGKTGRHPLPSRETFAATLGRSGVTNGHRIVAYDDASGAFAARLWWMVRWLGHAEVAVLDGGFNAWKSAGLDVTAEESPTVPAQFSLGKPLTRSVTADEVTPAGKLLLDARDRARYLGQSETLDPVAGHIPGAVSAPFTDNLTASQQMKSYDVLRERFATLGVNTGDDTICYCGSGVTATLNILAMVHAGFSEPALYAGSWSEWITDPSRPIVADEG